MQRTVKDGGPGRTIGSVGLARTLAAHDSAAPVRITGYVKSTGHPLVSQQSETPYVSLVGQTLDKRYLIDAEIGRGGMGVVYAATHTHLRKKVAIKVLAERYCGDSEVRRRFENEPRAAAKIGHKNIVDVTDTGCTESNVPYFVMEYLEGRPLASDLIIKDKDGGAYGAVLSWVHSQRILLQICDALIAAHGVGIIHRDIKPENILLISKDGVLDFVKVIDFGIVKWRTESSGSTTQTGITTGTPEYMSPEQATGIEPDARTDIYSLGALMYQILCGDVPFRGETAIEILYKHLNETPKPPREINPDIPEDVEAIILRALEKNRDHRFQTMAEVKAAIIAASGISSEMPMEISLGRAQKKPWLAIVAGFGAVILGTAISMLALRHEKPENGPVVVQVIQNNKPDAREEMQRFHTISIKTNPSGAKVLKGTEEVGKTPFELPLPESKQPIEFVLRLNGYRDEHLSVVPNRDQSFIHQLTAFNRGVRVQGKIKNGKPPFKINQSF